MSENKVQDKQEVQGNTPELFAEKYQALVKETGYQLVGQPVWVGTNHGSFEMVIQYSVGRTPKQE